MLSASVFIQKVSIVPGVKLAHAEALTQANVKYPVDPVWLKNSDLGGAHWLA